MILDLVPIKVGVKHVLDEDLLWEQDQDNKIRFLGKHIVSPKKYPNNLTPQKYSIWYAFAALLFN